MKRIVVFSIFIVSFLCVQSQERDTSENKAKVVLELVTNILDIYDMDLETLMQYSKIRENPLDQSGQPDLKKELVLQVVMDMVDLYEIDLNMLIQAKSIIIKE
jgi:hypothetical protein